MVQAGVEGELAYLLRPITTAMVTGHEPVMIGGLPRLPSDVLWPCQADGVPSHFFAHIDLAALPRDHMGHRGPDFPNKGTIFIFLPLGQDGFYEVYKPQVLFTEKPIAQLEESLPPRGLPNLLQQDPCYVHREAVTNQGTVLMRRPVEALPFFSPRPTRLFRKLGPDEAKEDRQIFLAEDRANLALHHKNLEIALRQARPIVPSADDALQRPIPFAALPNSYLDRAKKKEAQGQPAFDIDALDWRFVFDWAQLFYKRCINRAIKELRDSEANWITKWFKTRTLRHLEDQKTQFEGIEFNRSFDPAHAPYVEDEVRRSKTPPKPSRAFDAQAHEWLTLAQHAKGPLPLSMRNAFLQMLAEIDRRADEKGASGSPLPASIAALENHVSGSRVTAATTRTYALEAFELALPCASSDVPQSMDAELHSADLDAQISQLYTAQAGHKSPVQAILGETPLQIFGHGDAVQNAVYEHADDVLLMQIGGAKGLPLDMGPDMVLHLWIKPEDLAAGCFDHVEMTVETT